MYTKGQFFFTGDSFSIFFLLCGANRSTSLSFSARGYVPRHFFVCWGIWKCKYIHETGCDVRGVVQDWSQPLTCFLWCLFLVGEKQTSLLRGELTLLLWIKGNGSLNIERKKKKHMVEGFDYLQRSLREWGACF